MLTPPLDFARCSTSQGFYVCACRLGNLPRQAKNHTKLPHLALIIDENKNENENENENENKNDKDQHTPGQHRHPIAARGRALDTHTRYASERETAHAHPLEAQRTFQNAPSTSSTSSSPSKFILLQLARACTREN